MSRVKTFRFGPGALESITLETWRVPRRNDTLAERIKARVAGFYTVYCGAGNNHQVEIREETEGYVGAVDDNLECAIVAIHTVDGLGNLPDDVARHLIEWALEDWVDPCDNDPDELGEKAERYGPWDDHYSQEEG